MSLKEEIQNFIKGEVQDQPDVLKKYSRDKSIFEMSPRLVIFPRGVKDIKNLVNFISQEKKDYPKLSLTCRAAGTDMTGGPLTSSLLLVFTKHFNHIKEIGDSYAIAEPGVYYRDLEKETLKKGLIFPAYPASKETCALGGMVANDAGGEKSLRYGETRHNLEGLKVILRDGNEYYFEKLDQPGLKQKLALNNFEGEIYRRVSRLLENNRHLIEKSRPKVAKNSSGYNIWEVRGQDGFFDLTKLFAGSQGTLGIITEIKLKLVKKPKFHKLFVVFIKELKSLPLFVKDALVLEPTSLEVTDDHTFKIYLRYGREVASLLGARGILSTLKLFLPEIFLILKKGLPKLVVLAEFEEAQDKVLAQKALKFGHLLKKHQFSARLCRSELEEQKYWRLRRDTYNLLREKIKDRQAAPFIDDIIVPPECLPEFLPKLYEILDQYRLIYTISGHIGEGNLHIIPLINLKDEKERSQIPEIMEKVYSLVLECQGSLSAEHGDGLIRSPYLEKAFGPEVYAIFKELKKIFDPDNIFNPHKKIDVSQEFAFQYLRKK